MVAFTKHDLQFILDGIIVSDQLQEPGCIGEGDLFHFGQFLEAPSKDGG